MTDDSGFDPDFIAKLEKELNESVQAQIDEALASAKAKALEGAAKVAALNDTQRAGAVAEMCRRNLDDILTAYENQEFHVAAMAAVLFIDDMNKLMAHSVEKSENWVLNKTFGEVKAMTEEIMAKRFQITNEAIEAAGAPDASL